MNRYRSGGPSKASATTLCQKCLQRGHYSYECSAAQQQRPYTSRPSRTQQLLNPKLAPKIATIDSKIRSLSSPVARAGVDDYKRAREADHSRSPVRNKRARSASTSSDSVDTISTRSSRSPVPSDKPVQAKGQTSYQSRHRDRAASDNDQPEASKSSLHESTRPVRSPTIERVEAPSGYKASSDRGPKTQGPQKSRQRSLSPYSQRVALTSANATD